MADDDTDRFFTDADDPVTDLSASSDAISTSFALVDSAEDFETMASELRRAADHCHVAARRLIDGDVPRGCAHGFAAQGHMRRARRLLEELSLRHAERALLDGEDSPPQD